MPTLNRSKCEIEFQHASTDCAESVRPPWNTVKLAITGSRSPVSLKNLSMANRQAFITSVSKAVSHSRMSTPPSTSASICS